MTKTLTRFDKAEVIVVWQAITVTLFSLPLGLMQWRPPSALQWGSFLLCGVISGSTLWIARRESRRPPAV